jgi:hypothetical protein
MMTLAQQWLQTMPAQGNKKAAQLLSLILP